MHRQERFRIGLDFRRSLLLSQAAPLQSAMPLREGRLKHATARAGRTVPVIVLTAREGWGDKVAGFTAARMTI